MGLNEFSIEYILENGLDKSAYGFIYITNNITNMKKYIGQRKFDNYGGRVFWKNYLGSGSILKKALKKHGRNSFSRKIIAIAYSKEELNELEIYYIKINDAVISDNYYNISLGGSSTFAGMRHSEESKRKIGRKGVDSPNYGKHPSDETRDKLRKISKEKRHSEETKQKLKVINKGENNPNYGKHASLETKLKMSNVHKNISDEIRKKISEGNIKRARKIICKTTKMIFNCMKEAGDYYNCDSNGISKCCRGKINYSGKHRITGEKLIWSYLDEYIKSNPIPLQTAI